MNPSQSLNVIITAGDRYASRPVLGETKPFCLLPEFLSCTMSSVL